jgi:hypothetical protein
MEVKRDADGTLNATGLKWFQGDWKGGCEFEISGKPKGDVLRSGDGGKDPDTIERDHASLVVNRADDVMAKRRENSDNDGKCKRNRTISSTARLFPVKPSPDLEGIRGIR